MFDFLKKKMLGFDEDDQEENESKTIASGFAAAQSAKTSVQHAAKKFAKPNQYTGNRKLFDDGAAKRNAKTKLFNQGKTVHDPYTGDRLTLTKAEAKARYGKNWQKHLAESDHTKPLEQIFKENFKNPWTTIDDIKKAANSDDNIRVTSRKTNNAKRSRTNEEYVNDRKYREDKGIKFTREGEEQALRDGEIADRSIRRQLRKATAKNIVKTGNEAGLSGAKYSGVTAGTMSGITNMVAVIKGEKDADEAIADTVQDAGRNAVSGYAMSGGLTVVSQSLSNSGSEFLQALAASDVPGKVITAVTVTGNTLKRYADGEITTQECMIELGESGLNFATTGYSMAVGQALIPIPIVGGAIGALVGSTLTSTYYHKLIDTLQQKELEHQERLRIMEECEKAAEQTRAYRKELDSYLQNYFKDYQHCFDSAIASMQASLEVGDADGVIQGANIITKKLGGTVKYDTVNEFKDFIRNTKVDKI